MLKIFVRVFKFRLPFLKPLLFHQKDDRLLRNSFKSRYFAKFHSSTIPFRFSNISQNFSIRLELFSILQRDRTISLKVGKVKVIVSRIRAKRGRKQENIEALERKSGEGEARCLKFERVQRRIIGGGRGFEGCKTRDFMIRGYDSWATVNWFITASKGTFTKIGHARNIIAHRNALISLLFILLCWKVYIYS